MTDLLLYMPNAPIGLICRHYAYPIGLIGRHYAYLRVLRTLKYYGSNRVIDQDSLERALLVAEYYHQLIDVIPTRSIAK